MQSHSPSNSSGSGLVFSLLSRGTAVNGQSKCDSWPPLQSKQGDLLEREEKAEFPPCLGWSFISGFESYIAHISRECQVYRDGTLVCFCNHYDSSLVTRVTSWKNNVKVVSVIQWFMAFLNNQMQLKILICKNLGQILAITVSQNCVRVLHAPLSFLWEGRNLFHFLKWLPFLLLAEAELEGHCRNEPLGVWYNLSYPISELCYCQSQAFLHGVLALAPSPSLKYLVSFQRWLILTRSVGCTAYLFLGACPGLCFILQNAHSSSLVVSPFHTRDTGNKK